MNKPMILIFCVMLVVTVAGLFHVKYKVQNLKKDLIEINRQLATNKEAIHVLEAEWSYLNEPMRIKRLSDAYLHLSHITVAQLKDDHEIQNIYLARAVPAESPSVSPTMRPILSSYGR